MKFGKELPHLKDQFQYRIAALKLNRKFIGIERDPETFAIAQSH
ncbi:MAG: hypothetical protein WBP64_19310 [Nitrososphaeraceae archaeon]